MREKMYKKVPLYGMLTALAFLLGYVETLIPLPFMIPGMKLGLANLVTVVALYTLGEGSALAISLVRILLTGFTFGNLSMLFYSLAGGMLSFLGMALAKRQGSFGKIGVSIFGGVLHNLGQILVAMAVLETGSLLYYFPFLLVSGTVAGLLIGLLGGMTLKRLPREFFLPEPEKERQIRADFALAGFALLLAVCFFAGFRLMNRGTALEAVVYVDEAEYARLPLSRDAELAITGLAGGRNRLVIRDGAADVTEADCPDGICIRQQPITEIGQTIVCLPHRVVVTIE